MSIVVGRWSMVDGQTRKIAQFERFFFLRTSYIRTSYLAVVFLIIGSLFEAPEEGTHGLFAVRGVFLSSECGLVGGDLHEVFRTSCYSCCDCRETVTDTSLLRGHRGRTLHFLTQVQAVTIRIRGSGYTVSSEKHLVARVLTVLARFAECARHMVDSGTPFYFCHSRSAFCRTGRWSLVVSR